MKYLILGDGNFSFSLSLCKRLELTSSTSGDRVVATSFERLERVLLRPLAEENLRQLKDSHCVDTLHEVDATNLEACQDLRRLKLTFDFIIFNFPHAGGKNKIHLNRTLLKNFFISSSHFLTEEGAVHVSLCRGQGGTPADSHQRGYENSWKITEMATEGGLVLHQVEPFRPFDFPDYVPTGYRGHTDKGFNLSNSLCHVFKFPSPSRKSLWPPKYLHDMSFWCNEERFEEDMYLGIVSEVTGGVVESVECIGVYKTGLDPERG